MLGQPTRLTPGTPPGVRLDGSNDGVQSDQIMLGTPGFVLIAATMVLKPDRI